METKRMLRSRSERMLAGVAGGLATYFGIDPLFVRIAFVGLSFLNGLGIMIYLALWLIVPNEGSHSEGRATIGEAVDEMRVYIDTLVAQIRAAFTR